jgi:RimJ/RimL family protein N-acetyltransferase
MSAVVRTVIYDWGVSWMNLRHMRCIAWKENIGSIRVLKKNGFLEVDSDSDHQMVLRGEVRTQCILELRI